MCSGVPDPFWSFNTHVLVRRLRAVRWNTAPSGRKHRVRELAWQGKDNEGRSRLWKDKTSFNTVMTASIFYICNRG